MRRVVNCLSKKSLTTFSNHVHGRPPNQLAHALPLQGSLTRQITLLGRPLTPIPLQAGWSIRRHSFLVYILTCARPFSYPHMSINFDSVLWQTSYPTPIRRQQKLFSVAINKAMNVRTLYFMKMLLSESQLLAMRCLQIGYIANINSVDLITAWL